MHNSNITKILFLIPIILLFIILCYRNWSGLPNPVSLHSNRLGTQIDINNDGKSEFLFWNFYDLLELNNKFAKGSFLELVDMENKNNEMLYLGMAGDIPVYGDFSGDGITDYGIYRYTKNGNEWNLINGSTKAIFSNKYGEVGDFPIPRDYDGDGVCDFVVYRPKDSGFYGVLSYMNKILDDYIGIVGDIPIPNDYDGDGSADLSVYRLFSGEWFIKSSKTGLVEQKKLGGKNFLPIPSDYDGDGKVDLAVWNYHNNDCKILFSSKKNSCSSDKIKTAIREKLLTKKVFPLSLDIDGDKKYELAFWEYENKSVHLFKIENNRVDYKLINMNISQDSEPIDHFFLKKFIARERKFKSLATLRSVVNEKILNMNNEKRIILCDFDGDFINEVGTLSLDNMSFSTLLSSTNKPADFHFTNEGKPIVEDFDGDGKCEFGFVDPSNRTLNYFSSALNENINLSLGEQAYGIPLAFDIDSDFMADLIFYDQLTNICGLFQSSKNYKYDEVCIE